MHLFYGVKNSFLKSELQIPTFKNREFFQNNEHILCKCSIKNERWQYKKIYKRKKTDNFFFLKNEDFSNNDFFFLVRENNFELLNEGQLKSFEKFAVRSNLKIYLDDGGFSSYQSEYPFGMVDKKGIVSSSISSLANANSDQNYILFRNIIQKPIIEKFYAYIIDLKSKSKIHKYELYTNTSNLLKIDKNFLKPEIYFVTKNYLGIPSFISIKNKHLSFEHTHPPHAYILNSTKFDLIKKLKNKFDEIIN